MEMAFRELEKEKLLVSNVRWHSYFKINEIFQLQAITKYDENQMNASYGELCNIYDLIQKYFLSDRNQQMKITFYGQAEKNKWNDKLIISFKNH